MTVRSISLCLLLLLAAGRASAETPNVLLIYADDLGYGDLGCYGATKVKTPHLDALARQALRFTDAHTSASTCTPSRFTLLTGEYAFRQAGTSILPGDAGLIIPPGRTTLPGIFQKAGYATGAIGKWHLGLGHSNLDWNREIAPGPLEIGFTSCFLIPATGDRVPCVYVRDHAVVGLDPKDPITVSYTGPLDDAPPGKTHPELLKMKPSHGHDQTIVNGISRIGYMKGGEAARWKDEEMSDTLTREAIQFLESHQAQPFFLYFATHDIHVPRVPHPRFAGQTPLGPRGDVIEEFDDAAGQLLATLDRLKLTEKTMVIVSSDNGPVIDDGYQDQAVSKLDGHRAAGPWRGGKYSPFEGGTRVPFLVRWPGHVVPGVSEALLSQADLLRSFAALLQQPVPDGEAPDSQNLLPALLGQDRQGRSSLVEAANVLSLRAGAWKFISPGAGGKKGGPETGDEPNPKLGALYNLAQDPAEAHNLVQENPQKAAEMKEVLAKLRSTPAK